MGRRVADSRFRSSRVSCDIIYTSAMRVLHLSDLHITPTKAENLANCERALPGIEAARPDLAIVTGDLVDHGNRSRTKFPDEFPGALAFLENLPCAWLAVPGNHDVGDFLGVGKRKRQVRAKRVKRFKRAFGSDRFVRDIEGWRLIGLNSMIVGSGLPAEQDQWAWLESSLGEWQGPTAMWMHSPMFLRTPDEADDETTSYWCPPAETRRRLWELCKRHGVKLVATGHLHAGRDEVVDEVRVLWSEALSGLRVKSAAFPPTASHRNELRLLNFQGESVKIERVVVPLKTETIRL